MNMMKVLMADDDADILRLVSQKVKEEGYEVICAKDGEEAWQKIQAENPDIVVLDLSMPKMHGFEVLKALRENPPSQKWLPVIICSGEQELGITKKGFELEADHYVRKPCSYHEVIKAVKLMGSLIPQQDS